MWNELFDKGHEPTDNQIQEFVDTPLWDELAVYLKQTYNVQPKLFCSNCTMDKGLWKGWMVSCGINDTIIDPSMIGIRSNN
jgi:AraC family transcriptional regulator